VIRRMQFGSFSSAYFDSPSWTPCPWFSCRWRARRTGGIVEAELVLVLNARLDQTKQQENVLMKEEDRWKREEGGKDRAVQFLA
jgi:hypothetical protein